MKDTHNDAIFSSETSFQDWIATIKPQEKTNEQNKKNQQIGASNAVPIFVYFQ